MFNSIASISPWTLMGNLAGWALLVILAVILLVIIAVVVVWAVKTIVAFIRQPLNTGDGRNGRN